MKRGIVIIIFSLHTFLLLSMVSAIPAEGTPTDGGDANGDGRIDITDAVYILNNLFLGGEAPDCRRAVDVNGDGRIDLSDTVGILNFLFQGGQAPVYQGVAPGSCDIVGDMSGQTLINPETGQGEEIGDHVKADEISPPPNVYSGPYFSCRSRVVIERFGGDRDDITINDNDACEIPIYISFLVNKDRPQGFDTLYLHSIYVGCASDGKTDILEYIGSLECQDALDNIRAIPLRIRGTSEYGGIFTGRGDDYVEASDELAGNIIQTEPGKDVVYGKERRDLIFGGRDDDILYGGGGDDILVGNQGEDTLYGNYDSEEFYEETNYFFGGAGSDTIYSQGINGFIFGDEGYDVYVDTLYADINLLGINPDFVAPPNYFTAARIHGDDHIYSKKGQSPYPVGTMIVFGDGGNDEIAGSDGPDFIFGGGGKDTITGNAGDNFIFADSTLNEFRFSDTDLRDYIRQPERSNTPNFDRILEKILGSQLYVDVFHDHTIPQEPPEEDDIIEIPFPPRPERPDDPVEIRDRIFIAGGDDDIVIGGGDVDVVFGENGEDTLNGGLGDDSLFGGSGDDKVYPESGEDIAYGGNGEDNVGDQFGEGGNLVSANYGDDPVVCGGEGKDEVIDGAEVGSTDYLMAGPRKVDEPEKPENIFGHEAHTQTFFMNLYRGVADESNCAATDCYYTPNRWFELSDFPLPLDRKFQNVQPFFVKLPDCFFSIEIAGIPPSSGTGDGGLPPV